MCIASSIGSAKKRLPPAGGLGSDAYDRLVFGNHFRENKTFDGAMNLNENVTN